MATPSTTPGCTTSSPACLRCAARLAAVGGAETLTFWRCAACQRDFTLDANGELTARWLSPITLPLYCVLFDPEPQHASERVAAHFREHPRDVRAAIVADIRDELAHPTQRLAKVLDRPVEAREEDLRAFLRGVAELLSVE